MRKIMLMLAAAGLSVLGIFTVNAKEADDLPVATVQPTKLAGIESTAPVPTPNAAETPTAAETSVETPTQTETERATAAPTPTLEPTPVATETPRVTPIPTPGVQVGYYYRSSLVYYATLIVSMPEQVTSVSFRLIAPDVAEPALEIELTPQQIADRFYQLRVGDRDDGFDANPFFASHEDAELTMELTYTVQGDAGEQTHTETFEPSVEPWIDWRFDSEEDVGGIAELMFGQIFPNCFTVRIYETTNLDLQLSVGADTETLPNGGVSIQVSIDGRDIPAEVSQLYSQQYRYQGDETVYCDYVLVIPIPEDFPQHGTATMTLTRKLTDNDAVIMRVKEIDY